MCVKTSGVGAESGRRESKERDRWGRFTSCWRQGKEVGLLFSSPKTERTFEWNWMDFSLKTWYRTKMPKDKGHHHRNAHFLPVLLQFVQGHTEWPQHRHGDRGGVGRSELWPQPAADHTQGKPPHLLSFSISRVKTLHCHHPFFAVTSVSGKRGRGHV